MLASKDEEFIVLHASYLQNLNMFQVLKRMHFWKKCQFKIEVTIENVAYFSNLKGLFDVLKKHPFYSS